MQDKFLIFFGTVFGGRALAYGRVDQSRLPDDVKGLLVNYRWLLLVLCAAVVMPLMTMNAMAMALFIPLVAITFILKHKFEKQLDPLLEPYIPKDNAADG